MGSTASYDWFSHPDVTLAPFDLDLEPILDLQAGSLPNLSNTVAQILLLRNNPEVLKFDDNPTVAQLEWQAEMECYPIQPRRAFPRTPIRRGIRIPIPMPPRSVQAGPAQIAPQLLRSDEEIDRLADKSEWLEREYGMEMGWLALLRYYVDLSRGEISREDQDGVLFCYTPTARGQDYADRQLEALLLDERRSEQGDGEGRRRHTIGLAACGPTFRILVFSHQKRTIRPEVRPWGTDNHPFDIREPESIQHLWETLLQLPRMSMGRRVPKEIGVRTHPYNVPYSYAPLPMVLVGQAPLTPPLSPPPSKTIMLRTDSGNSNTSESTQSCVAPILSWSTSSPTLPQMDITLVSASATFAPARIGPCSSDATEELIRAVACSDWVNKRLIRASQGGRSPLFTIQEEVVEGGLVAGWSAGANEEEEEEEDVFVFE